MKWVFTFLKPLRSRIALGVGVKIIGTVTAVDKFIKKERPLHPQLRVPKGFYPYREDPLKVLP